MRLVDHRARCHQFEAPFTEASAIVCEGKFTFEFAPTFAPAIICIPTGSGYLVSVCATTKADGMGIQQMRCCHPLRRLGDWAHLLHIALLFLTIFTCCKSIDVSQSESLDASVASASLNAGSFAAFSSVDYRTRSSASNTIGNTQYCCDPTCGSCGFPEACQVSTSPHHGPIVSR